MAKLNKKRINRFSRQAFCPSALTAVLAGLLPAGAQAQPAEPGMRALEEVVVTARRREENLQEVPIAVTAMGAEYLRANNIAEFSDLRVHVPSLSIGVGGSSTNVPQVALRGLRPEEVLITLDPAVPMYFADVVMTPTHGTNLAMYDLANVQVLKGPQGTLFGRNSTGGAILVQPQTPGTELGGYVEARAGNYSLHGLEGAIDVPVNDRLQFRLAGRMLERDGYQSNVADNPLGGSDKFWDEDSSGARLSVNLQVTDSLSNLLVVGYDQNDMLARVPKPLAFNPTASLGTPVNLIHNGGLGIGGPAVDEAVARSRASSVHDIETDLNGHDEVENTVVSNTTTWELGNGLTVKNIFGYRKVNYAGSNDSDGTALPLFGSIAEPDANGVTWDVTPRVVEAEQFTNELQLLGTSFDDRLQWLAGLYWYDMEATEIAPTMVLGANPAWPNTPPPSPSLAPIWAFAQNGFLQISPNGSVQNESYAVFAEGTYSLTDRLDLTLGVRQTWDERQVTLANERMGNCLMRDRNGNLLPNDACSRSESERFSSPSWRAVANYRLDDTSMVYGSVATGYRSGGFNARGTDNLSLQPFDEETVLTYELGHKADWSFANGATLRTSLAVYLSKYEDIQRTQDIFADGALATNVVNAAEAEVKGIELEALFRPTRNLEMMLAVSFVDMEYKKWMKPDNEGNLIDASDADFIWIPEQSANAYVKYYLPVDPGLGEISLMVSAYWQDEVVTDDNVANNALGYPEPVRSAFLATEIVDAYSVVNVRADWRNIMGSKFDVGVWANNLEDKEYAVGGLTVEDSQGWSSQVYGAPRTYGATLRYTF